MAGTIHESGGDHSTLDADWGETLANGQWSLSSGTGSTYSGADEESSYSGGGAYALYVHGGLMQGTITESGADSWAGERTVDLEVAGGAWTDGSGSGWESASGGSAYSYSGSGGGSFSVSSPRSATLQGTMQESGGEILGYDYSIQESLGTDGSWCVDSGSGHDSGQGNNSFNCSGSGSYSSTLMGNVVSGTITDAESSADSSQFDTTSVLGTDGNWISSGGGAASASGQTDISYSGSGSYSRPVDSYVTATGALTENGGQGDSYGFSEQAILAADGSVALSGGGSSRDYFSENFAYSGGGSYSSSSSTLETWDGGYSASSQATDESFTESGGSGRSWEQLSSWVRDSGGWRAAQTTTNDSGSANGSYVYDFGHTESSDWGNSASGYSSSSGSGSGDSSGSGDGSGDSSGSGSGSGDSSGSGSGSGDGSGSWGENGYNNGRFTMNSMNGEDDGYWETDSAGHTGSYLSDHIAESFAGSFGRSITVSTAADGTQVTSGVGGGSMSANGSASHDVGSDWSNSDLSFGPGYSHSSWAGGGSDTRSTDSYGYAEGWSQASGDTSTTTWASGSQSGSATQSNYSASGWSDWTASSGSTSGGSSSSGGNSQSYNQSGSGPGFAGNWYYPGTNPGYAFGGPTAGMSWDDPGTQATATDTTPETAGWTLTSSGSGSGSATGSGSESGSSGDTGATGEAGPTEDPTRHQGPEPSEKKNHFEELGPPVGGLEKVAGAMKDEAMEGALKKFGATLEVLNAAEKVIDTPGGVGQKALTGVKEVAKVAVKRGVQSAVTALAVETGPGAPFIGWIVGEVVGKGTDAIIDDPAVVQRVLIDEPIQRALDRERARERVNNPDNIEMWDDTDPRNYLCQ
ncbi:MAG: hypothetical protein ACHRHE_04865 [Tepidisphaerales bacterium]